MRNYLLVVALLFIHFSQALSQAPAGHANVWQSVQDYWDLWAQRDLNGFLKYHHEAYSGWDYSNAMHRNKTSFGERQGHLFKTKAVITYEVNPIDIKIHDKTAMVHYYFSVLQKDDKGNEKESHGRKTDVLIFERNKWLIIASHGGITREGIPQM